MQSSMLDLDKSTSNSLEKRYAIISIVIPLMNSQSSRRRQRSSRCQKNQPPRNEWEEDEEPKEVVKDEPTPSKTSPQTKQVWKEKVTSSESPSQEVQPSRSPSPGPTDAPKE